jgi:hypothetical protein
MRTGFQMMADILRRAFSLSTDCTPARPITKVHIRSDPRYYSMRMFIGLTIDYNKFGVSIWHVNANSPRMIYFK